jgi:hypothetical protein
MRLRASGQVDERKQEMKQKGNFPTKAYISGLRRGIREHRSRKKMQQSRTKKKEVERVTHAAGPEGRGVKGII